jgi:transcriptional regulator with XRE-family HTH domain
MREQRKLSQEALGASSESDRTFVSMLERGLVSPTLRTIVKLSKGLSVAPSEIIRRTERSTFYHTLRTIRIDAKTFSISLCDRQNRPLQKAQLSAGEKQIYAVSMLWALAKTSGRPLPIVIDTPLARLDSDHRRLLIEHYFPTASHQVIILSTDTEVDQLYFDQLRPAIARVYHLDYDQGAGSTAIKQGYFWRERDEAYKAASN